MMHRTTRRAVAATGLLMLAANAVIAEPPEPPEPQGQASGDSEVTPSAAARNSAEYVQSDRAPDAGDAEATGIVDELIAQYFDSLND